MAIPCTWDSKSSRDTNSSYFPRQGQILTLWLPEIEPMPGIKTCSHANLSRLDFSLPPVGSGQTLLLQEIPIGTLCLVKAVRQQYSSIGAACLADMAPHKLRMTNQH